MKHFFRTVLTSLQPSYLVRQYVFGGIVALVFYFISRQSVPDLSPFVLILNFLLYPYAMFVYDSLIGLLMGENIWFTNGILAIIWGIFKVVIIFIFSIFIAPLGIAYLYFTYR